MSILRARTRRPSLRQWILAWAAAVVVSLVSSYLIARRQVPAADSSPGPVDSSEGGEVSEVASYGDGPEEIYPDQAVSGYPESESGMPDEGPAGPNARPDWQA